MLLNGHNDMYLPDCPEFVRGYENYNQQERLGPMWFRARRVVQDNWGNPSRMSEGVRVIINGWNRFFAGYDDSSLTATVTSHLETLDSFRDRDISSFTQNDKAEVLKLFNAFQEALKRTRDGVVSPVSAAKALSLFASGFLPIWDSYIAYAYHCGYVYGGGNEYVAFIERMKILADHVRRCVPTDDDRSLLKRIDEFNYAKYTKRWV